MKNHIFGEKLQDEQYLDRPEAYEKKSYIIME